MTYYLVKSHNPVDFLKMNFAISNETIKLIVRLRKNAEMLKKTRRYCGTVHLKSTCIWMTLSVCNHQRVHTVARV